MGSMGGLYTGVSGLNVSQAALNITSHNLANVDTKGYVRQQVVITDQRYIKWGQTHISPLQKGLGADFAAVRQVRDIFLDQSYRQELGRQAFYDSQYQAIEEMEGLFGELEGEQFQKTMEEFWISLQELAKEPDSIVTRASLIQTAVTFVERAETITNQLKDYQINLNTQIRNQVNRINEIGNEIKDLNVQIRFYESTGKENANDLRDQRNLLLDELSKMVQITYKENQDGMVNVNVEGVPFVSEETVFHMGSQKISEDSQMLKPVWISQGNREVYPLSSAPSAMNNTDVGSLKGLLVARGNRQAKYTDIPQRDQYNNDADYDRAVLEYNNEVGASTIMAVQAQFDQLIHGIVTGINDTLSPNKEVTLAQDTVVRINGSDRSLPQGTVIKILDEDNAPVGMDADNTMGEVIFNRKSVERYNEVQEITILGDNGEVVTVNARIYNEEDPQDNYSLFTLGEIEVNPKIMNNYSLIPLSSNDGTGAFDIEIAQELLIQWQKPFATISPDTLTTYNFNDYYNAFISEIANRGQQLRTISTNQESMINSIDNQRLQITGVSSDEELTNLIRYQHAYNAAARYVNVVDKMLEHLIVNM